MDLNGNMLKYERKNNVMAKYKEILTVEQLLEFCKKQNFQHFSSTESGYRLAVKVPTTFEEVENADDGHRGMMKLKFRIFHTGLNRNGSFVSEESAEKAMNTIADRPVLAAIHQLDDGTWDFEGHEMRIIENENGETDTEYIESQVGSFSSEPAFWEHDDDLDKDYVCAYAYISEEYTKAAEIIRAKNGTKNSCELFIDELAYNAKEKYLELKDFFVNGSTLLGKRNDGSEIGEGMLGSRADIVDFSVENNSVKFSQDEKLIHIMQELKETLDSYTVAFATGESTKGGNQKEMNKFDELLSKYGKSIEDITFEYKGLSDEELEAKFVEIFEEPKKKLEDDDATATTEDENPEEDSKPVENEPTPTPEEPEEEPIHTPVEPENNDNTDDNSGETFESNNNCSIELDGVKREFAISLNDKQVAIDTLVNDTYGESDNDYFYSDVYEDSKTVVMHGLFSGKHYRQSYKEKKGVYSLSGDRISVFAQYLTQDEISKLDSMKANYSSIEEKLAKYEAEPEKLEILESDKYSLIADKVEFTELKKQENHFDLSVDELKAKADEIILQYAYVGQLNFASTVEEEHKSVGRKTLPINKKITKRSRYGGLGKKED